MATQNRHAGEGTLSFSGYRESVVYDFQSDPKLTTGKGSIIGGAEELRAAFKSGYARLKLESGKDLPVTVVAHTEGGDRAYFEIGG
jgi:hypothetical protein